MGRKIINSILIIIILFNVLSVLPYDVNLLGLQSTSEAAVCTSYCGGSVVYAGSGVCGSTDYVITGSWEPVEVAGPKHNGHRFETHLDGNEYAPLWTRYNEYGEVFTGNNGTWVYSDSICLGCGRIIRYRTYQYKCNECGKEATETSDDTLAPGKMPLECPAGGGKHLFNTYNDVGATCYKCEQTIAQSFGPCNGRTTDYYDCTICGHRYYGTNPGTCTQPHNYDSHAFGNYVVTSQATCTQNGSQVRTCSRCGTTDTAVIPALGHIIPGAYDYTSVPGYHIKNCQRCGTRLETYANPYTVVYNGNGATFGSTGNSTHTYGINQALNNNRFCKDGLCF